MRHPPHLQKMMVCGLPKSVASTIVSSSIEQQHSSSQSPRRSLAEPRTARVGESPKRVEVEVVREPES